MTASRAYLDYNASAPLRPAARAIMHDVMDHHGNPSSVHGEGRNMRRIIEAARAQVSQLVNCNVESVIFTSGATEAAHLAMTPEIKSGGSARPADVLCVLESEHPCVSVGGRFSPENTMTLPVDGNGVIDMDRLDEMLSSIKGKIPFVAVQLANSETGVVQPVAEVATRVRLQGGYTLCDAVQAAGRIDIDVKALGVDFLLLSAHKLGGPQGIGALINVHTILDVPSVLSGGGQEKNRRAGTENVVAIAGFGAACEEAAKEVLNYSKIATLRDSIEAGLLPICSSLGLSDRLTVLGADAQRLGNTSLIGLRGLRAETALIAFDLEGVAVSSGSACSSGKVGSSHVLQAMGVENELAQGAIRVSLGWNSSQGDVEKFLTAFERVAKRLAQQLGNATKQTLSGAA